MKTFSLFVALTFVLSCAFLVACNETTSPVPTSVTDEESGVSTSKDYDTTTFHTSNLKSSVDTTTPEDQAETTAKELLETTSENQAEATTKDQAEITAEDQTNTTVEITTTGAETSAEPTTRSTHVPIPPTASSPSTNKWHVESDGKVCILMKMAAQIKVKYTNSDNVSVESYLNIPKGAEVNTDESTCGPHHQILRLDFDESSVSFTFSQNKSKTFVSEIIVNYFADSKIFPGSPFVNENVTAKSKTDSSDFVTSNDKSLVCRAEQTLSLTEDTAIMIEDLQIEAFRTEKSQTFSESEKCTLDKVKIPVIVPIVVGCILGGLLLIVIIAFFIGKRRFSSNRPYEDL